MFNPIAAAHHYIKTTPFDAPFFKNITLVPVVGQVVQIWKRSVLMAELKAIGLDTADLGGFGGKATYNRAAEKAVDVINLDVVCNNRARWVDFACIIGGIALCVLFPPLAGVGVACAVYGCVSLIGRNICVHVLDDNVRKEIAAKLPEGADLSWSRII